MYFIKLYAKVPRLEENQLGKNYKEEEEDDRNYVWGPLSVKVEDIDKVWGQSKNRSVVLMYSGEIMLVAEHHDQLISRIEEMLKEREEAGLNNDPTKEPYDEDETEDVV